MATSDPLAVLNMTLSPLDAMTLGYPSYVGPNCDPWRGAQHFIFQIANLFFGISFVCPTNFKYHLFVLRSIISCGCLSLVIWSAIVVCHIDVIVWYLLFLIINIGHLTFMFYQLYPHKFPAEVTGAYQQLFEPFKVSRYQFKELAAHGKVKELKKDETYALEGTTLVGENLSLLLSGKLAVSNDKVFLHYVEANQFVDSAEYESTAPRKNGHSEETFQVTVRAVEDCLLLTWSHKSLHGFLKGQPFLQAVFTNLLGKDVTTKLYQVQELLMMKPEEVVPTRMKGRNSIVRFRHRLSLSVSGSTQKDLGKDGFSTTSGSREEMHVADGPEHVGP